MSTRYTVNQWRNERSALNRGDPPVKCPSCGRTGFYAPREDSTKTRQQYHSCSFCGFWQDVGGDPGRASKYECHGHVQIQPPGAKWHCPGCNREKTPTEAELWPVDDPQHRWWQVPQYMSQGDYVTYWRMEWGHDAKPYGII